ncbi:MAG: DUF4926 domain-containing protein [Deltaproteobacteria bacterium]|nr:DUF4926 domain-containing protein [Deltaproteobacteria bacterium]
MDQPKLLDVVALLKPLPFGALELTDERYDLSSGLTAGTVGTVVEIFPRQTEPPAYLVEFSDPQGCGYAFATVPGETLLVLHYAPSELFAAHP